MGLKLEAITAAEVLPSILRKVRFGTLDELYASIGYGGTTAVESGGPHPGRDAAPGPPPGGEGGGRLQDHGGERHRPRPAARRSRC